MGSAVAATTTDVRRITDERDGALVVVLVDRHRARVLEYGATTLRQIHDTGPADLLARTRPPAHPAAGSGEAPAGPRVSRPLDEVVATVRTRLADQSGALLLVGGDRAVVRELEQQLPAPARARLAARLAVGPAASADEIIAATRSATASAPPA